MSTPTIIKTTTTAPANNKNHNHSGGAGTTGISTTKGTHGGGDGKSITTTTTPAPSAGGVGKKGQPTITRPFTDVSPSSASIYDPTAMTKSKNGGGGIGGVGGATSMDFSSAPMKPAFTFDSNDFLTFLGKEIDISRLVVETKDGQRISASFTGSRFTGQEPRPTMPVQKSLENAFKSMDTTTMMELLGGSTDGAGADNSLLASGQKGFATNVIPDDKAITTETKTVTPASGTVSRQQSESTAGITYLQPLKGEDAPPLPPPAVGTTSRLSSLGSGAWDPFSSSDWAREYGGTHVEVKYSRAFDLKSTDLQPPIGTIATTGSAPSFAKALPPKKRPASSETSSVADDMDLDPKFDSSLNPLLVAAARMAERAESTKSTTITGGGGASATGPLGGFPVYSSPSVPLHSGAAFTGRYGTGAVAGPYSMAMHQGGSGSSRQQSLPLNPPHNKKKRKPRKIIPDVKEFVEFNDKDVLFGRGGRSNHHPGNKEYRDLVTSRQPHYKKCEKTEKTQVAQAIVDHVHNVFQGRFLELDKETERWYVVPNIVARRKVGQALREDNTEEARAAKRRKYLKKAKAEAEAKNVLESVGAVHPNPTTV